jgi:hypothetical protein
LLYLARAVWACIWTKFLEPPFGNFVSGRRLNGPAAEAAAAAAAAWTNAGVYALLPWSCVVLECVPLGEVADVRGADRWDEVEWLGKEQAAGARVLFT